MLVFVGLGLNELTDITLAGMEWIRKGDKIYLDTYTNIIPNFSIEELEKVSGKRIIPVGRKMLETDYEIILNEAKDRTIVLLSPGDPFVATTHMQIMLSAIDAGIKTKVIHSVSILSAIFGETGLSSYKFGRMVTVTFPYDKELPETPYDIIKDNMVRGLHTLLLLYMDVERKVFMKIKEAINILRTIEEKRKEGIITHKTLAVGCARIGSDTQVVRANYIYDLVKEDFGDPPHTLIIVGKLHFIEAEALVKLAKAPKNILEEYL